MAGQSDITRSAPTSDIPKPSGRPRKEITGTNTDRQRAQLRRSQKAFRARKENYANKLQEKCKRLEGVVAEMASIVLEFGDSVDQTENLGQGLGESLRIAMDELSSASTQDPNAEESEHMILEEVNHTASQHSRTGGEMVPTKGIYTPLRPNNQTTQSMRGSSLPPHPSLVMNHIWSASTRSGSENGRNALSYVLLGRDSFASRLYFETVILVLRSLHGELPASIANHMLRFKLYYCSGTKVRAILDSVLKLMLHGTSQPIRKGAGIVKIEEDEADPAVKVAIMQQVQIAGGSEDDYLSSWNVEQYLKTKWRLALDSNTVKVQSSALLPLTRNVNSATVASVDNLPRMIFPTMVPGFHETSPSIWNAEGLIDRLKPASVSVGEGPRWHVADIDEAVEAFLIEKRESK